MKVARGPSLANREALFHALLAAGKAAEFAAAYSIGHAIDKLASEALEAVCYAAARERDRIQPLTERPK